MTYVILVTCLLGALIFAFFQGRRAGKIKTELLEARRQAITKDKVLHALSKAVDRADDLAAITARIRDARTADDFNRLYEEITGLGPGS